MLNLKKMILASGVSAILTAAIFSGCGLFEGHSSDRTAGRALDDKTVTENVKHDLDREPVYKFSDVDVKTFNGVVQLSGFVNTSEQKNRAGEIAQRVQGVNQVVNNITLKELTPTGTQNSQQPYQR